MMNVSNKSSRAIKKPKDNDVLFGRGGSSNNQIGNKRYQEIVESRAIEYSQLTERAAKTNISWEIVQQLKKDGARFLRKDKISGFYFETSDDEFRKKVSQRLRERALEVREYVSSQEETMDDSSNESQHHNMDTKPAARNLMMQVVEDNSVLAGTNMSTLFSPGHFLNEPWYQNARQQDYIQEPERLSSRLHLSPFKEAVEEDSLLKF